MYLDESDFEYRFINKGKETIPVIKGATHFPLRACIRTWSPTWVKTCVCPMETRASSQKLEWAEKSSRVWSYCWLGYCFRKWAIAKLTACPRSLYASYKSCFLSWDRCILPMWMHCSSVRRTRAFEVSQWPFSEHKLEWIRFV